MPLVQQNEILLNPRCILHASVVYGHWAYTSALCAALTSNRQPFWCHTLSPSLHQGRNDGSSLSDKLLPPSRSYCRYFNSWHHDTCAKV